MQDSATYSYDVVRDFAPVTLAVWLPCILAVHPLLPVKSVKYLISLAKTHPGGLNFEYAQRGAAPHLAAELFKSLAGVKMQGVSHSNTTLALTSLLSGELQVAFPAAGAVAPHLKSGRLRILALTSAEPSALFPGLPTIAATLPGYESVSVTAIFAPAKTPSTIIARLNQEIVTVLNQSDIKDQFAHAGISVVGSSPEQLAEKVKSETVRMGRVIRDAGLLTQ